MVDNSRQSPSTSMIAQYTHDRHRTKKAWVTHVKIPFLPSKAAKFSAIELSCYVMVVISLMGISSKTSCISKLILAIWLWHNGPLYMFWPSLMGSAWYYNFDMRRKECYTVPMQHLTRSNIAFTVAHIFVSTLLLNLSVTIFFPCQDIISLCTYI